MATSQVQYRLHIMIDLNVFKGLVLNAIISFNTAILIVAIMGSRGVCTVTVTLMLHKGPKKQSIW